MNEIQFTEAGIVMCINELFFVPIARFKTNPCHYYWLSTDYGSNVRAKSVTCRAIGYVLGLGIQASSNNYFIK